MSTYLIRQRYIGSGRGPDVRTGYCPQDTTAIFRVRPGRALSRIRWGRRQPAGHPRVATRTTGPTPYRGARPPATNPWHVRAPLMFYIWYVNCWGRPYCYAPPCPIDGGRPEALSAVR